jgi:hypothetical protein
MKKLLKLLTCSTQQGVRSLSLSDVFRSVASRAVPYLFTILSLSVMLSVNLTGANIYKHSEAECLYSVANQKQLAITPNFGLNKNDLDCEIQNITIAIIGCYDGGTTDDWLDDTFTANVTVTFQEPTMDGNLQITSPLFPPNTPPVIKTVSNSTTCTFEAVTMIAGVNSIPISITAFFVTNSNCSFTNPDLGDSPFQCSVCRCGGGCNRNYPACWPDETPATSCEATSAYIPDANFPEQTPVKYIKTVLHIFQKEDPNNPGQVHPTDPGNFTAAEHIGLFRDWFNSALGVNGLLGGLCEDTNNPPPYLTDTRIRLLNHGNAPGHVPDIFFHPDNEVWGISLANCNLVNTGDLKRYKDAVDRYIHMVDPQHPQHSQLTDPETQNAMHVFLTGGTWIPVPPGNPQVPDDNDCYNFTQQAWNWDMRSCPNGNAVSNPVQIIAGLYEQWKNGGVPAGSDHPPGVISLGRVISGEFFHLFGVDHISPLQRHSVHEVGVDGCDDTPTGIYNNNFLGCNYGQRCALSKCQIGRMHQFLEENQHPALRFPDGSNHYLNEPCVITEPTIIIPDGAAIVWEGRRRLQSSVVVQSGGQLTINCDVGFPENATLTVEAGGRLIVNGARLYNNCDGTFWGGILVLGRSSQRQSPSSNQGYARIRQGASIENATFGIRLGDSNIANSSGGILLASDATFKNCRYLMAQITNYQNHNSLGQPIGNATYFTRCNFLIDGNYFGNFEPDFIEAVSLRNVTGIEFNQCVFQNDFHTTETGTREEAIHARSTEFSATGCNFSGFNQAVYAWSPYDFSTFRVKGSTFSNNAIAISAQRINNAFIVDNDFIVGHEASLTPPLNSDPASIGLQLHRCTGYKVEGNDFTVYQGAGTIDPVGALVVQSGDESNEVYRNTYTGVHCGNLAQGDNRGDTPTKGLVFSCNTNSDNQYDFAVTKEGEGIAQNQGASNLPAGNTFTIPGDNQFTHYYNELQGINYFYPSGQIHPSKYTTSTITKIPTFSVNTCTPKIGQNGDGKLTETEVELFETELNSSFEVSVRAYAANMLIRNILTDSANQSLSAVRPYLASLNTMESRFGIVETWLQEALADSAEQAMNAIPNQITLTQDEQAEYSRFVGLKTLQINALRNNLSEEQMVVANENALTALANAGDYYASVQAQLLLNDVLDAGYRVEVDLPDEPEGEHLMPPSGNGPVKADKRTFTYVKAAPNPAKNITVFHYRLPETFQTGKITVTTADGRLVWETNLEALNGKIEMDLGKLDIGVYFYNLVSDGKVIITEKLVIAR